jgi:hypothetical protein
LDCCWVFCQKTVWVSTIWIVLIGLIGHRLCSLGKYLETYLARYLARYSEKYAEIRDMLVGNVLGDVLRAWLRDK